MIFSSGWQLYVIVDRAACRDRDLAEVTAAAIRGGADVIQLRDKAASADALRRQAQRLLPITRDARIPLIINDRADVVASVGADGVHLGQGDGPIQETRTILGPNRLIGRSTHSLEQALAAQAEGADYLGLGPIFPTPTKPESTSVGTGLITQVKPRIRLPMVCIGGIDCTNVSEVLTAGAACVAVVRAVCGASDPESAARALKALLEQTDRAHSATSL